MSRASGDRTIIPLNQGEFLEPPYQIFFVFIKLKCLKIRVIIYLVTILYVFVQKWLAFLLVLIFAEHTHPRDKYRSN